LDRQTEQGIAVRSPIHTPASAKQTGATASERIAAQMCERSFLKLWSYPNVYRDQGRVGHGHGKELCDILTVFGDDVVIFSDKSCSFPGDPIPTRLAWRRWYKRAIHASIKQLLGAERWLREHPQRLFLDRACQVRFPIDLPPAERMRVHRIVVASGAAEPCRRFYGGDSGSLMLSPEGPSLLDERPHDDGAEPLPFVIGRLPDPFTHVLDEVTFPIVLGELDTVADFASYLRAKEKLIERRELLFSAGEEHLLAYYLTAVGTGLTEFPKPPDGRKICVNESLWPGVSTEPAYLQLKEFLRPSYAWDKIMQMLSEDILADRMVMSDDEPAMHEQRIRALARPPRSVRRELAIALGSLIHDHTYATRFRAVQDPRQSDTAFLFLCSAEAQKKMMQSTGELGSTSW